MKPDAPRIGTIVSLTDKCGSCVILQICGTCHDDVNDPGFEFEVEKKIEAQKHGTIVPSATRGSRAVRARATCRARRGWDRWNAASRSPTGAGSRRA